MARLKRAVAKRVVRARAGLKRVRKRALQARASARQQVRRGLKTAQRRATTLRSAAKRGLRVAKRRATALRSAAKRGLKTARRRVVSARVTASRRVKRGVNAVKRAVVVRKVKRAVRGAVEAVMPVPAAFAKQRASATVREQLLFELARARASVKAATQGLSAGTAEQPIAPGKWSIKEIVLHLSERDRVRLEEFARTLGGQPRSWAGIHDPEMAAHNEAHLAPLRAHSWDDAVRRLDTMREQLLLRLSHVPAEPDDVWQKSHPFGDMMWNLPDHDRHHARQIKHARIGELLPVED